MPGSHFAQLCTNFPQVSVKNLLPALRVVMPFLIAMSEEGYPIYPFASAEVPRVDFYFPEHSLLLFLLLAHAC